MNTRDDEASSDWASWLELSYQQRRAAIADKAFWTGLSDAQRESFLAQAEWQEIRDVPGARAAKLESLIPLDEICRHLTLTTVQVYWLMSTRKLPGWLVGGAWRFDRNQVDRWVEDMGGIDAVRADVAEQIAQHEAQDER